MRKLFRTFLYYFDRFRIYGLPVLAILGVFLALFVMRAGSQTRPFGAPVSNPPTSEFNLFIAGAGIIESQSENISIASPVSGVVEDIKVSVGSKVVKGDSLFTLDASVQSAQVVQREGALLVAEAQKRDAQSQYEITQRLADKSAMSFDEVTRKKNAFEIADARVKETRGGLDVARAELEQRTIKAPIDGEVLKIDLRKGEFVPTAVTQRPLIVLGDTSKLRVRVDVDENDAWRVKKGAKAKATLRGNSSIGFPISFVRFEPYVIPKRSLTGDTQERVDTRVLQILYEFDPKDLSVFVGQLVDVFIEDK